MASHYKQKKNAQQQAAKTPAGASVQRGRYRISLQRFAELTQFGLQHGRDQGRTRIAKIRPHKNPDQKIYVVETESVGLSGQVTAGGTYNLTGVESRNGKAPTVDIIDAYNCANNMMIGGGLDDIANWLVIAAGQNHKFFPWRNKNPIKHDLIAPRWP